MPLSLSLLTKPVCWRLQKGNNSETREGESYPHPHQLWGGATGLREQTQGRAEIRRNLWRSPSSTQLTAGVASRLDYMLLWTLPSVKYPRGWRFNKPSEQSAPTQLAFMVNSLYLGNFSCCNLWQDSRPFTVHLWKAAGFIVSRIPLRQLQTAGRSPSVFFVLNKFSFSASPWACSPAP